MIVLLAFLALFLAVAESNILLLCYSVQSGEESRLINVESKLNATGLFRQIVARNCSVQVTTLAYEWQGFHSILVFSTVPFNDGVTLGNVLVSLHFQSICCKRIVIFVFRRIMSTLATKRSWLRMAQR